MADTSAMNAAPFTDEPLRPLLALAEEWAREAGMSLAWRYLPGAASMLTHRDAAARAMWRCALELAGRVERASGERYANLLRDLGLEPAREDAERPGG